METAYTEQAARVQLPLCDRILVNELSDEYVLPEYLPEIRQLLRVRAELPPPTRYLGAGTAEFAGTVRYRVLYVGGDGSLQEAPLSAEYRVSAPFDRDAPVSFSLGGDLQAFADGRAETVTGRVLGPRKLGIRCRLETRVQAFGAGKTDAMLGSGVLREPERLRVPVEAASVARIQGEPLVLEEDWMPEELFRDGAGDDARIVCCEGTVHVEEVSVSSGKAQGRGTLSLKLFAETSDGTVRVLAKTLPLEGTVEGEALAAGCECRIWGDCTELTAELQEDRIALRAVCILQAQATRREEVLLTSDLYLPGQECVCSYADLRLPTALRTAGGNLTVSEVGSAEEWGIPEGARVLDAAGTVIPDAAAVEELPGKYALTGSCRLQLLILHDGEYRIVERTVPFRYRFDGALRGDDVRLLPLCAQGKILSVRCRADGGRMSLDAEVALSYSLSGEQTVRVLAAAEPGETVGHERSCLRICYPEPGERLWEIGKRYRVPLAELSAGNGLPEDGTAELEGVPYLMIQG